VSYQLRRPGSRIPPARSRPRTRSRRRPGLPGPSPAWPSPSGNHRPVDRRPWLLRHPYRVPEPAHLDVRLGADRMVWAGLSSPCGGSGRRRSRPSWSSPARSGSTPSP